MAKLFGLLGAVGAIAIGVAVFYWRKNSKSSDSMWDEAGKAADKIAGASSDRSEQVSDLAGEAKWRSSQFQ